MKQLSLSLVVLFCLLLFIANTCCLVHQFTAHQVRLSPKDSIAKKHHIDFLLKQHNPDALQIKKKLEQKVKSNKQGSSSVNLDESKYVWVGNISVGTPPQYITVGFDPFYEVDLQLIASKPNLKNLSKVPPAKTYNSSASSSYVKQDGNFTSSGTGYIGSDIVSINGLSRNMTFGIVDKIPYQYSDVPINGSFGLHLSASKNNITSAPKQIVEKLDKPVITVFQNRGNTVSTASATVDNSEISVELNSTVYTDFEGDDIWCNEDFKNILINATGAVHNSTFNYYHVDCATIKTSQVTLNIGEKGNTKELVLTGADYIEYDQAYRACYLTAQSSPDIGAHLFLGRSFFKNHCFTYNVNEKTIAFSKAKNI